MSGMKLSHGVTRRPSFGELTILTVPELAQRLKVSERGAYRIASELPPGCVIRVRHGVRIVWERALEALTAGEP